MNPLAKFILLLSTLVITSCATMTSDIEIKTYANQGFNYRSYESYAWAETAQIVFDPIGQWEQPTVDTDVDVRTVISNELRARNLKQVDKDSDLLVTFSAGVDPSTLGLKEYPDSNSKILSKTPDAALVIALIDTATGYTVWTGHASGDPQEQQTIENIRARISYAIHEIFNSL